MKYSALESTERKIHTNLNNKIGLAVTRIKFDKS